MTRAKARLRIGTSGYQYDHWRGRFYPEDLPKKEWLHYYAGRFDTVEINNTFYQLPAARTFDAWRSQAPGAFSFALKFSRYGSHLKRLRAPRGSIATFLERAKRLEDRLGPILVQLPPRWGANRERLGAFLAAAPREQPWAIEFRDPSWLCKPIYEVLREHNAALCIHDLIRDHPLELTADWVYLRFHGIRYGGSYAPRVLQGHARRIREWLRQGLDVFAYFNNDAHGYAVSNALDLRRFVEGR